MLLEVLANSYDQYLAGRCSRVSIEIAANGTITIEDDGPGIGADGVARLPLEQLLGHKSDRPTVDGHRPHAHLGLGGMGLFVVNALSDPFELRSVRDGSEVAVSYARGRLVGPLATRVVDRTSGTRVRFRPDPAIFRFQRAPRTELSRQLEDLTFLAPGLSLAWKIDGDDTASAGLAARVALEVPCAVGDVATHRASYTVKGEPIDVDVALAWRRSPGHVNREAAIDSFVNLARTRRHGTHVDGLLEGVRTFLGGRREATTAGLVAAVSVVLADVKYGEPDKSRLESMDAREPVETATQAALEDWARACPQLVAEVHDRVGPKR
jgi:DNA gyrase subunit B